MSRARHAAVRLGPAGSGPAIAAIMLACGMAYAQTGSWTLGSPALAA
jgi:hypothetical protein